MGARVFLAGATGAIGKRLTPLLRQGGTVVFGTTRTAARASELRSTGIEPIIVDVFDAPVLTRAMVEVAPQVVVHQSTDLALIHDQSRLGEALTRNARLRTEGTHNLVAAALEAGARRLIAQSIAWVYGPDPEPHTEADPLDLGAGGTAAITVQGVVALEQAVLTAPPFEGIVLRYGWLYGPGTGTAVAARLPAPARRRRCPGGGAGHRPGSTGHLQHRRAVTVGLGGKGAARARMGSWLPLAGQHGLAVRRAGDDIPTRKRTLCQTSTEPLRACLVPHDTVSP
jgi:nucleoside-diphosphate-sugar epimerase